MAMDSGATGVCGHQLLGKSVSPPHHWPSVTVDLSRDGWWVPVQWDMRVTLQKDICCGRNSCVSDDGIRELSSIVTSLVQSTEEIPSRIDWSLTTHRQRDKYSSLGLSPTPSW